MSYRKTLLTLLVVAAFGLVGCALIKREAGYILDTLGPRPTSYFTNDPPSTVTAPR